MRSYRGERTDEGCVVETLVDDAQVGRLALMLNVANHSPTGFEWGYAGSGPAQLAVALLYDAIMFGNPQERVAMSQARRLTLAHYQEFKRQFVENITDATWSMTAEAIIAWLQVREEKVVL
jgi:hypothetical protein